MKKFLFILSFFICSLGLSVSSMAYQSKSVSEIPFIEKSGGVHRFSEILVASKYPETTQKKWKEMCSVLESGGSNEKFVVVTVSPDDGSYQCGWISFILVEGGFQYQFAAGGQPSVSSNKGGFESFSFSLTDAGHNSQGPIIQHYSNITSFPIGVKLTGKHHYILRGAAKLDSVSTLPDAAYVIEDADIFLFEDDLGTFEELEEPDPPSSSEPGESIPDTPKPPDYTPAEPVIPDVGSDLVPYDTSVWKTFLDRTRRTIGSITNVAFLLFFLAFAFPLLIKIIKKFTK